MNGIVGYREATAQFRWPDGVERIPAEEWARGPLDTFGLQYDRVRTHSWYKNLEPTVAQVLGTLDENKLMVDYSSGTGILAAQLLAHISYPVGILNVDASPKFLRVAVENFKDDDRVAFRLIRYLKEAKRLQTLDEAIEPALVDRGCDVLTSTNAIHLYYDLASTVRSWHRVLRPGALAFMCSGNVLNPQSRPGDWIIDETVARVNEIAEETVRTDPAFEQYRPVLDDADRMRAYRQLRDKVFVPVRPLDYYLDTLEDEGFTVLHSYEATIHARVDEWHQLLTAYNEGVLGWFGGTEKIAGTPPAPEAVRTRVFLIRYCLERIFPGQATFPCSWTYITCRR
jgi:SAM-dependent methyltransferase